MKTPIRFAIVAGLASVSLLAQQPPPEDGDGHRPPPSPIIGALDADHDGIITAAEITNAPAALGALDQNGDGELTREEVCPPPPPRPKKETAKEKKDSAQHRPPPFPIVGALDSDHDKIISAAEIAAAPTALTTLDKNADGALTPEEFLPPPPHRVPHGSDQSGGGPDHAKPPKS